MNRGQDLTTDAEELRAAFERLARCSMNFRRSRKGNYVNPPVARDWKWFRLGRRAAIADSGKPFGWYCELVFVETGEVIRTNFFRDGPLEGPDPKVPGFEWRAVPVFSSIEGTNRP